MSITKKLLRLGFSEVEELFKFLSVRGINYGEIPPKIFRKTELPQKNQIPLFYFPFGAAPVIEQFFCILNDKWNDGKPQAFFQSNQSADSPVAVLERMSTFKLIMKTDYVVPCLPIIKQTFSRSAIHMLPCTCQWFCQ